MQCEVLIRLADLQAYLSWKVFTGYFHLTSDDLLLLYEYDFFSMISTWLENEPLMFHKFQGCNLIRFSAIKLFIQGIISFRNKSYNFLLFTLYTPNAIFSTWLYWFLVLSCLDLLSYLGKTNSIQSMIIPNPPPIIITRKEVKQFLNPKGFPVLSSHVGGNGSHFLKILSKAPFSRNWSM